MFPLDASLGEVLIENILDAMRGEEKVFARPLHRSDCPYVQCRKPLVAWIIEVCEALGLGNVTTFHACNLMDRAFLFEGLNQKSAQPFYQLVAMVCILIAAKYGETDDKLPSMAELNEMSENAYPLDHFRKAETQVLNLLGWRVTCLTPLCFLKYFLGKTCTGNERLDNDIYCIVVLLLGLAVQDHEFMIFLPSLLAASAVFCARTIVAQRTPQKFEPWTQAMETVTGYSQGHLAACHTRLLQKYHEFLALQRGVPAPAPPEVSSQSSEMAVDWDSDSERQSRALQAPTSPPTPTTISAA